MGIFSDLAKPVKSALETVGGGIGSVYQSAGLPMNLRELQGSRVDIRLPSRRPGESDQEFLRRREAAIDRLAREPEALSLDKRIPEAIARWRSLLPEQKLLVDNPGELVKSRGPLDPLLPEKARNIIKGIPVIGEETERIASGISTPVGIATGIVAPQATLFGALGAGAGGLAGQAAEEVGIDPRLNVGPVSIGPRGAGEILGGLYTGPRRLGTASVDEVLPQPGVLDDSGLLQMRTQLDDYQTMLDNVKRNGFDVDAGMQADLVRMRAQLDPEPLQRYNFASQLQDMTPERLQTGVPEMLETTFDKVYQSADDFVGGGPLRWLPQPARWVVDRFSPALTLKEGSTDWIALNYHTQINNIWDSAALGLEALLRAESDAGFLQRGRGIMGFTKGVPLSDELMTNVKPGKGGLAPTVQNIMEKPGSFTLTPIQQNAVDSYQAFVQGTRNHAVKVLEDFGFDAKAIDEMLPTIDGPYFHRVVVDADGNVINSARKYVIGETQAFQQTRVPEGFQGGTRVVDSLTASAQDYATQVGHVLLNNTVWKPMLKKLGVSAESMVPQEFVADLAALRSTRDWLKRAEQLVRDAKVGRNSNEIVRRVNALMGEQGVPEGYRRLLERLTASIAEEAGESVPLVQRTKAAARATARSAKATDEALRAARTNLTRAREAFARQTSRASGAAGIASEQSRRALDRIQKATDRLITAMQREREALARAGRKGAGAAARAIEGSGTSRVAARELIALFEKTYDMDLPPGVATAIGDIEGAARQIAEGVERAAFTAGDDVSFQVAGGAERAARRASAKATEAAAAAQVAASRATRQQAAAKGYRAIARQVEKELKQASRTNSVELQFARDQAQQAKRMISKAHTSMLDMQKFPGFSQWRFDKEFAKQIGQSWRKYEPGDGFWNAVNQFMALEQAVAAGTFDIGQFGLQLASMLAPDSAHMIPVIFARMWSSNSTRNYIVGAADRLSRSGESMRDLALRGGLKLGVEVADPISVVNRPGGLVKGAMQAVTNWKFNKAFTNSVNMGRMVKFENGVRMVEAITGAPITDDALRAIARTAGTMTGDFNWTRAGVSQGQRVAERTALRFAPGWFRSQMKLITTAASPVFGTEANFARYALATEMASIAGVYSAMAYAMGQTPQLSPVNADGSFNKDFMTLKVKGVKMGPGGPILSLMRTAGKMADLAQKAADGDAEALSRLTNIKDTGNPLTAFWRGGAPVLTGLIYDIVVQGRESYGDRQLGLSHPKETALAFIEGFEPFAVQALREEGPLAALGGFTGGRAFPLSAAEKFTEGADAKAQELGFESWAAVPEATKADLIRTDAELQELAAERDKYFERFKDADDAKYQEIEQSRDAVEDMLLGSYAAVQAGTIDLSEFRQRFTDLTGQHAYVANQLLDGADEDPTKRDDETKQDYYARLYSAIQPEKFDQNQDGVIEEFEWQAWRDARNQFWSDYPEASNFRSYIKVDYPSKKWKSEDMAAISRERYSALDLYDQFLAIPKYRGMTVKDAAFVDSVRSLKNRIETEALYNGQQITTRQAWGLALREIGSLTPKEAQLVQAAVALDKPRNRDRLLNPERVTFLQQPGSEVLYEWYPSVLEQAGLGTEERGQLGLPLGGTSALDLVSEIRGGRAA